MAGPKAMIAAWLARGSKRISRTGLYPFLERELGQIARGRRVLSIGAGGEVNELLLGCARDRGFTVVQLDVDADRNPDVVADICTWQTDDKFDVVVAAEVLEHLPEPAVAISNIRRLLHPGGRLIATTPFTFPIHDAPHDFYRYTRHGLAHLLRDWREVTIETRSTWPEVFGVLAVRMARERKHRPLELVVVPTVLAMAPLLRTAGRLFPSEIITSGYTLTAIA